LLPALVCLAAHRPLIKPLILALFYTAAHNFSVAQGMNDDFICNDDYTGEVFDKVASLKNLSHWRDIDSFMGREYHGEWLDYKNQVGL